MPPYNGIESVRQFSAVMPMVPIVMYTMYKTGELEAAAKRAGAAAVVAKEDGVRQLLAAVDAELAAH
jgi:DNA-binding NarL/FixJ family response regulator